MIEDEAIQKIGQGLWPFLTDVAEGYIGHKSLVVGICFPHQTKENSSIVIAEELNEADTRKTKEPTERDVKFVFPNSDPFVTAIKNETTDDFPEDFINAEPENILTPFMEVFSNLDGQSEFTAKEIQKTINTTKVRSIALGVSEELPVHFYIIHSSEQYLGDDNFDEKLKALHHLKGLLINPIRQAIFVAAKVESHKSVEELKVWLSSCLDHSMPNLTDQTQIILESMLHPSVELQHGGVANVPQIITDQIFNGPLTDDEERMCRAVNSASKIVVKNRLSGSFRDSSVLQVEVTPTHDERFGVPAGFEAVLKSEDRETAVKSFKGLQSLWGYHNLIKHQLPQTPQYFSYVNSAGLSEFAVITPHISATTTLFELVSNLWDKNHENSTQKREELMSKLMSDCRIFLDEIGIRSSKAEPNNLYNVSPREHLDDPNTGIIGSVGKSLVKRERLKNIGWPRLFKENPEAVAIQINHPFVPSIEPLKIINPYHLLQEGAVENAIWNYDEGRKEKDYKTTFAHGDFHAGNVLYENKDAIENSNAIVLDFDYVGSSNSVYSDLATLEASLILGVSNSYSKSNDWSEWKSRILPSILILDNPDSYNYFSNYRSIHDLVTALWKLTPIKERENGNFSANIAVACYRLLRSHHKVNHNNGSMETAQILLWSACIMCGLALKNLVRHENRETISIDLLALDQHNWT